MMGTTSRYGYLFHKLSISSEDRTDKWLNGGKKRKKKSLGTHVSLRNLTIEIFQYPFNNVEINFLHVLLTRIDYFML